MSWPLAFSLSSTWAYCVKYMKHSTEGLEGLAEYRCINYGHHGHWATTPTKYIRSGPIFINTALQMYTNPFIMFVSLCCVFPLRRWDGSCQSAPIYRTIPKSLLKKCVPYGVSSVTIVWRRQKHQYPRKQQYRQLLFLIESRFNLKANAKRKSIHPIKTKPLLPAFPKLIHQHLHMHPTEFNHAVYDEPSRLLEYLWDLCSQHMSAMCWWMRWFSAFHILLTVVA